MLGEANRGLPALRRWVSGGRSWWAHFEFTRINIELTILQKEIEESLRSEPKTSGVGKCVGYLDLRAFQGERQTDFWPFLAFLRAAPEEKTHRSPHAELVRLTNPRDGREYST